MPVVVAVVPPVELVLVELPAVDGDVEPPVELVPVVLVLVLVPVELVPVVLVPVELVPVVLVPVELVPVVLVPVELVLVVLVPVELVPAVLVSVELLLVVLAVSAPPEEPPLVESLDGVSLTERYTLSSVTSAQSASPLAGLSREGASASWSLHPGAEMRTSPRATNRCFRSMTFSYEVKNSLGE